MSLSPAILQPDNDYDRRIADGAMSQFSIDWWEEVLQDVLRGRDAVALHRMAQMRQARIKQHSDALEERVTETFGTPRYRVDPEVYHAWAWYFRDANDVPDYSCWDDPEFIRELLRDNEECRVKTAKPGNRVGWTPALARQRKEESARGLVLTDERGNVAA